MSRERKGTEDDEVPESEGYAALTREYGLMGGPPPEKPPPPPKRATSSEDASAGEKDDAAVAADRTHKKIAFGALRDFVEKLPRVEVWNVRQIPKPGIVDSLGSTFEFASNKQMLSAKLVMSFKGAPHGKHAAGVMEDVFVRYFSSLFDLHWERPCGGWLYAPVHDPKPPEETYEGTDVVLVPPAEDTPFARAQAESDFQKAVAEERRRRDAYIDKGKHDEVRRIKRMEHSGRVLLRVLLGDDSGQVRRMLANAPISAVVVRYLLGDPRECEEVSLLDLELFDAGKAAELRQVLAGFRSPYRVPRRLRLNVRCLPESLQTKLETQLAGPKMPPPDPAIEEAKEKAKKKKGKKAAAVLAKEAEEAEERRRLIEPVEVFDRESVAHAAICVDLYSQGERAVINYINKVCHWELIERRRKGLDAMKRGFQSISLLSTTLKELDSHSVVEYIHSAAGVPVTYHSYKRHIRDVYNLYGKGPPDPAKVAEEEAARKTKLWV